MGQTARTLQAAETLSRETKLELNHFSAAQGGRVGGWEWGGYETIRTTGCSKHLLLITACRVVQQINTTNLVYTISCSSVCLNKVSVGCFFSPRCSYVHERRPSQVVSSSLGYIW